MRSCLTIFEDDEFEQLNIKRGKMTWRRWILKMAGLPYEVKDYVNIGKYCKKYQKVKK